MLKLALDLLAKLLAWSLGLALAGILCCVSFQVAMRYGFGAPPPWSEELALLMFSWLTIGGLAYGVREGFHVALDIEALLPKPLRQFQSKILDLAALFFGLYLAWAGWRFVDLTLGEKSAAIRYPIELLHSLPVVSGALMALFAFGQLVGVSDVEPAATPEETAFEETLL